MISLQLIGKRIVLAGYVVGNDKGKGKRVLGRFQGYVVNTLYILFQYSSFIIRKHLLVKNKKLIDYRFRSIRVVYQGFGTEHGDAVNAAEQHIAIADAAIRTGIKLIALQPVHYCKIAHFTVLRVKTTQSLIGTDPQAPVTVFQYSIDNIAWQTVVRCILLQLLIRFLQGKKPVTGTYPYRTG